MELLEQTKLLGVIVTSNLSWAANTDFIVSRCNSKIWVVRRLRKLWASRADLIDIFCKQIRNILEFAAPVWNSSLVGEDISNWKELRKPSCTSFLK